MQITLYQCGDDPRTVRKTLQNAITISAEIKEACSTETPDFFVAYDDTIITGHYNYAGAWGRYYYIGDPDLVPGQGMILHGRHDVLMTYADQIAGCPAVIRRSSALPNTYLDDPQLPVAAYRLQQVLTFADFTYIPQAVIVCVG